MGAVDDGALWGVAASVEEEVGAGVVAFLDGVLEVLGDAEAVVAFLIVVGSVEAAVGEGVEHVGDVVAFVERGAGDDFAWEVAAGDVGDGEDEFGVVDDGVGVVAVEVGHEVAEVEFDVGASEGVEVEVSGSGDGVVGVGVEAGEGSGIGVVDVVEVGDGGADLEVFGLVDGVGCLDGVVAAAWTDGFIVDGELGFGCCEVEGEHLGFGAFDHGDADAFGGAEEGFVVLVALVLEELVGVVVESEVDDVGGVGAEDVGGAVVVAVAAEWELVVLVVGGVGDDGFCYLVDADVEGLCAVVLEWVYFADDESDDGGVDEALVVEDDAVVVVHANLGVEGGVDGAEDLVAVVADDGCGVGAGDEGVVEEGVGGHGGGVADAVVECGGVLEAYADV